MSVTIFASVLQMGDSLQTLFPSAVQRFDSVFGRKPATAPLF